MTTTRTLAGLVVSDGRRIDRCSTDSPFGFAQGMLGRRSPHFGRREARKTMLGEKVSRGVEWLSWPTLAAGSEARSARAFQS